MKITNMLDEYRVKQLEFLTIKVDLMKLFSEEGFEIFYNESIESGMDSELAYVLCDHHYKLLLGRPRFSNYETFKSFLDNNFTNKDSDKKLRIYLMAYFKEKGFDSWVSFKPLIICYFPQVTPEKLQLFYEGKQLDKEVLKYVDYVRQIIGK